MKKTILTRFGILILLVTLIVTQSPSIVKAQTSADSFSFTAVGDYGNDKSSGSAFTSLLKGIGREQPNFHLALGDLLYTNSIDYNSSLVPWCDHVKKMLNSGAGKAETDSWGQNFPFEIIAGNHDTGESNANIITNATPILNCLPHRINNITESSTAKSQLGISSSYGIEYYFDYPSTSNPIARVILVAPDLYGFTYAKGTNNYNFVKNSILDARAKNIPWIIVGKHKNCITNGTKGCEYSQDLMNMMAGQDLGPNGSIGAPVDVVLEGHEHSYHRSKQLKVNTTTCTAIKVGGYDADCVGNAAPTYYKKGDGQIIDIIGTGGVSIRSISGASDNEAGYFASWMGSNVSYPVAGQENSWGFVKFTVTRTELSAKFIATSGKNFSDTFVISADPNVTNAPTPTQSAPTSTPKPATPTPSPASCPSVPAGASKIELSVTVPTTGKYKVWSRIMSTVTGADSYYFQVDNQCPIVMGNVPITQNVWTWIDYMNGSTATKATLDMTAGVHLVKLISYEQGVSIDKVIITSNTTCIPTGTTGSECTSVSITPTGTKKPGDADGNGSVNVLDYQILSNNFGKTNSAADFNGDGKVNVLDYQILSNNFGK